MKKLLNAMLLGPAYPPTRSNIICSLIAKYKPKRFDRLNNAIAGSLSAILAILASGAPLTLGYF